MKNSLPGWQHTLLAAFGLLMAATTLPAQTIDETKPTKTFNIAIAGGGVGGSAGGVVAGFTMILDDIGEKLLKQIDADKDGSASYAEFKTILQTHFQKWDANQSGTLSTNELTAGLRTIFPAPEVFVSTAEPPAEGEKSGPVKTIKHFSTGGQGRGIAHVVSFAGEPGDLPLPPEPSTMVAQRVLEAVDADMNKEISTAEWEAAISKWFTSWDFNENGLLNADDLADGFHQLAGPPDDEDFILFLPE